MIHARNHEHRGLRQHTQHSQVDAIRRRAIDREAPLSDAIVEKTDPRGKKYYWIGGEELEFVDEEGTDFHAVSQGLISVTPIHLDLTNYKSFDALQALRLAWP